ncbi:hypothetical protein Pcinc_036890, partial [Petrolisthes cinctipes]
MRRGKTRQAEGERGRGTDASLPSAELKLKKGEGPDRLTHSP